MRDQRRLLLLLLLSLSIDRGEAQSMLGDFFSSALSVFKPLVEERRSHVREQSTIVRPMLDAQRDQKVLGAPTRSPMHDVPICNGDGKLCAFISCQAENFKNDQSFANINLAAQVLADKKLRHQVGDNPDAINAVCMDSGMDASRCGTFTRGFQMISKLINSIEQPIDEMQQKMPAGPPMQQSGFNSRLSPLESSGMDSMPPPSRFQQLPGPPRMGVHRTVWRGPDSWGTSETRTFPTHSSSFQQMTTMNGRQPVASIKVSDDFSSDRMPEGRRSFNDDDFAWAKPRGMPALNPLPGSPPSSPSWGASSDSVPVRALGSQTWGSGKDSRPEDSLTNLNQFARNDFVASFTPIPPTAPPLAFPTVRSVLPSMEDLLMQPFRLDPALEKMLTPIKIEPILRYRRHADDFVRVVEHLARRSKRSTKKEDAVDEESHAREKRAEDYYDQADAEDSNRPSRPASRGGSRSSSSHSRPGGATTADDYYDEVDTSKAARNRNPRPGRPKQQRNCFELLG